VKGSTTADPAAVLDCEGCPEPGVPVVAAVAVVVAVAPAPGLVAGALPPGLVVPLLAQPAVITPIAMIATAPDTHIR